MFPQAFNGFQFFETYLCLEQLGRVLVELLPNLNVFQCGALLL